MEHDEGVIASFQYLVALSNSDRDASHIGPPIPDIDDGTSTVRLAAGLCSWVDRHSNSLEYAEIAKQAGADAIAFWSSSEDKGEDLFGNRPTLRDRWLAAGSGSSFSEVSRYYFARLTERYLRYFLDREASSALPTIATRDRFSEHLTTQIDAISRHAFETSKITQSFAAGWYNRHGKGAVPNSLTVRRFLRVAFQKIREELAREAANT
jgi:hypothetical protein